MRDLRPTPHKLFLASLAILFLIPTAILAVAPHSRSDWLLENVLVALFILFLGATFRRLPLSRLSYSLIFIFLLIHEVGAHYTYSEVPYDHWFRALFGASLNDMLGWQRNNFDRVVHFSYGLLLAYPIREVYFRVANLGGFWGYFLPLDLTMSTSMLYELIEWAAAEFFGGELGAAYLGTQGDIWDAHKDMSLASLGALLAMLLTLGVNLYLRRDFAREWSESFKVKHSEPLGEDAVVRLLKKRKQDRG